jgi:VanZ family protein
VKKKRAPKSKKQKIKYKFNLRESLIYWLPVYIIVGVVTYLSLTPIAPDPRFQIPHLDKVVHVSMYFAVSFVLARALTRRKRRRIDWHAYKWSVYKAVSFAIFWGLLMEYIQEQTWYRAFEWADVSANSIGALIGGPIIIPYKRLKIWWPKKKYIGRERRPVKK